MIIESHHVSHTKSGRWEQTELRPYAKFTYFLEYFITFTPIRLNVGVKGKVIETKIRFKIASMHHCGEENQLLSPYALVMTLNVAVIYEYWKHYSTIFISNTF